MERELHGSKFLMKETSSRMFKRLNLSKRRWMTEQAVKYIADKNDPGILDLHTCWNDVNHCMVCWPESGIDVLFAETIFHRLKERFENSRITTIVLPGMTASLPDIGVNVVNVRIEHFSVLGLPTRKLKQLIQELNVDVAIDLSEEYNPFTSYCCCISGARLRVGFSNKQGGIVFNYQIAPNMNKAGIDRYRTLASYIG